MLPLPAEFPFPLQLRVPETAPETSCKTLDNWQSDPAIPTLGKDDQPLFRPRTTLRLKLVLPMLLLYFELVVNTVHAFVVLTDPAFWPLLLPLLLPLPSLPLPAELPLPLQLSVPVTTPAASVSQLDIEQADPAWPTDGASLRFALKFPMLFLDPAPSPFPLPLLFPLFTLPLPAELPLPLQLSVPVTTPAVLVRTSLIEQSDPACPTVGNEVGQSFRLRFTFPILLLDPAPSPLLLPLPFPLSLLPLPAWFPLPFSLRVPDTAPATPDSMSSRTLLDCAIGAAITSCESAATARTCLNCMMGYGVCVKRLEE